MTRPVRNALAGAAALLVVAGGYFGGRAAGLWGVAPIRIGTILPLTGPDAAVGLVMKNAMALAVDEANRRGGVRGRRVELIVLPETDDREQLKAVATQLAADPSILAVAAHVSDDAVGLTTGVLRTAELANLLAGASDSMIFEMGRRSPLLFRLLPDHRRAMRVTATHFQETVGRHRFLLLHDYTWAHMRQNVGFKESLRPPSTYTESELKRGQLNFEGQAQILKVSAPEQLLLAGSAEQLAALLTAMRAAGATVPVHLVTRYPPPQMLELAKGSAEGVTATFQGLLPEDTDAGKAFLAAYAAAGFKDKEPPGLPGLLAYAEVQVLLAAIDRSALTRPSVSAALKAGKFDTAIGRITFDGSGQAVFPKVAIYQVTGGRWVPTHITNEEGRLVPHQK